MKYSIIMPAYNEDKNIKKSIYSLLSQDYDDFELIVIDDGSTDLTLNKIVEIKDSRLKVLSKANGGVSSARNLGLKHASGKFVLFIDADDEFTPNFLNYLDLQVNENENVYQLFKTQQMDQNKLKKRKTLKDLNYIYDVECVIDKLIKEEMINSPWGKVYRSSLIFKNKLEFDESLKIGEDLLFNLDYITHCNEVVFLDTGYYTYNIQPDSLTFDFTESNYQSLLLMYDKIKQRNIYQNRKVVKAIKEVQLKNELSYLNWSSKNKDVYLKQLSNLEKKDYRDVENFTLKLFLNISLRFNKNLSFYLHRYLRKIR